jgi:ribosomal protein L37AE/L43A
MATGKSGITWADKVRKEKIARLYETDARGLRDDELVDDVGYALYVRCVSILEVTEAARGRAKCHACGHIILHGAHRDEVLHCEKCGWEITWAAYKKSYRQKQLFGGAALQAFKDFVARFPNAQTYPQKMLLIDTLIHEFHWNLIRGNGVLEATRPAAANLIDCGKLADVAAFLGELSSR